MRIDNNWNLQTSSYGRCLRVTVLLFVLQLFAVTYSMAEDKLVIPKLNIKPGTTQQLAVQLVNEEAYVAFQAEFYFPEGIKPAKTSEGKYIVSLSSRGTTHSITANEVSDGGLKLLSYSMGNTSLTGNSGDLFYIDIVSEPTFDGEATIEVKDILFTRASDRKEIALPNASGIVDTKVVKGDANQDGEVNVTDIVATVNKIMGHADASFNETAADVNNDGEINVTDIVMMVNIIMTGGSRQDQQEVKAILKEYGFIFKGEK
ncbi:MAG: dockerin type I repeat-containing protein [Prevotella sp.]|nr:dockerin type I repeat-containing protein [Prevotella sp.]